MKKHESHPKVRIIGVLIHWIDWLTCKPRKLSKPQHRTAIFRFWRFILPPNLIAASAAVLLNCWQRKFHSSALLARMKGRFPPQGITEVKMSHIMTSSHTPWLFESLYNIYAYIYVYVCIYIYIFIYIYICHCILQQDQQPFFAFEYGDYIKNPIAMVKTLLTISRLLRYCGPSNYRFNFLLYWYAPWIFFEVVNVLSCSPFMFENTENKQLNWRIRHSHLASTLFHSLVPWWHPRRIRPQIIRLSQFGELRNGHVANLQELYYTRLVRKWRDIKFWYRC